MNESIINFLNDSIEQLIVSAKEIKKDNDYDQGIRIGFYHTISFLITQAIAFGVFEYLDNEIKEFNLESLI